MKIVNPSEALLLKSDFIFRTKSAVQGPLSMLVGFALIGLGVFAQWWGIIVLPMGVYWVWASVRGWQSALRKTNWLLRIRDRQVLIKFRSLSNWRFPEDEPQIIALETGDIAFARSANSVRLTMFRGSSYSQVKQKKQYLDIGLKIDNSTAAKQALEIERQHPGWGNRVLTTKVDDDTVQWVEPNVLRLDFEGIAPNLAEALRQLGQLTEIVTAVQPDEDYSAGTLRKLGPVEQRQRLSTLARSDPMAAFSTIHSLYRCSGSEATRMIEEFQAVAAESSTVPPTPKTPSS
jgi:hypothetical protein